MKVLSFDVGIKNLAYCLLQTERTVKETSKNDEEIIEWGVLDISVPHKDSLIYKLFEKLKECEFMNFCDIILIEKQPNCNPTMRSISIALQCYFVFIGRTNIIFYSPRYKLNCYTGYIEEPKVKSEYSKRKKLANSSHKMYFRNLFR